MSAPVRDHAWAVSRLPAYSMGLLEEDLASQVEAHVADCESCQAAVESMQESALEDFGHLPSSLLTNWASRNGQLEGVQRELTRRHLESCDSCRQILTDFGHEPVLPRIEALEANAKVLALLPPHVPSLSQRGQASPVLKPESGFRLAALFQGGLIGGGLVAAAAALMFVLNPGVLTPPQPVPTPIGTPQPVASAWTLAMESGPPDQLLISRRGQGEVRSTSESLADSIIQLRQDQRTLRLAFPQIVGLRPDASVVIELRSPDGTLLDYSLRSYRDVLRSDHGLAVASPTPFEPGRFVITLRWIAADGTSRSSEYPLDLRR